MSTPRAASGSPAWRVWRRLRRRPDFWAASSGILVLVLLSFLGPLAAPDTSPNANAQHPAAALQWQAGPLGTDALGRDTLSRFLLGGRISLAVGALAVGVAVGLGLGLGLLAGTGSPRTDATVAWFMTVVWSVPTLVLALAVAFVLGRGLAPLALAIGLTTWVELARVVRGRVRSLQKREFILATHAIGVPKRRVWRHHLLPNLWGPVLVVLVTTFSTAVLLEAGLSFLGLGVAPPTPSWGSLLQEGYPYVLLPTGKWLVIIPAVGIALLVLSLNLLAVVLRDALAPRD